jgi:ribonuclease HI
VVDSSCLGDPESKWKEGYFYGRTEWRGVDLYSGEVVFNSDVYQRSTINIGEFCAIVDALKYLNANGLCDTPVYSDSKIAISWVQERRLSTKLPMNPHTREAIIEAQMSLSWLCANKPTNRVLFWDKYSMGENPADYGRK